MTVTIVRESDFDHWRKLIRTDARNDLSINCGDGTQGACSGTLASASARWNADGRPLPDHRIDEAIAGVGMALSARLQHMAQQE